MFDPIIPQEITALLLTLKIAAVATLCALPFGLGAALLLRDLNGAARAMLSSLLFLPLVMPPVVTGYALLLLFGRHGALGAALSSCCGIVFAFRWQGAALAAAVMGFPLMVRAILIALEGVDRRLPEAAATLGASPLRRFATITVPLAAPGLVAGAVIGFAKALGEFGATITFVSNIEGQTQTLATLIYDVLQSPMGETRIWRLCLLSAMLSLGALLACELLQNRAQGPRP